MFYALAFDDVMISETFKFDYFKNEKSFRSKELFFIVLQVLSFELTKQTSKNAVDKKVLQFSMILQ